ncbi:MAG: DUF58 domain-containing protein [Tissierellales bacterium]
MEIKKGTAEVGEEIEITSIIENKKPLTVSFLKVHERFPKGFSKMSNIYTLFIMPYQRVRRTYKIYIEKRGFYSIQDVQLELGDFVGFKTEKENVSLEKELIVFPVRAKLENSIAPFGSLNGDVSVKRWILDDPLMTIGIREYTGNEPERFIHWPSSVKYGNLMVKNFDFTTDNSVIVVLNVETMKPCWKPVEEELIEKVISIGRSVMEEFEALRIPYGFTSNAYNVDSSQERGCFYHPSLGQIHLDNLLKTLGKIDYRLPSFFETTLRDVSKRQGNYTTVVIITPRILDTYIESINMLSKSVSRTVVISVEEEHLEKLNNNIIKYRSK